MASSASGTPFNNKIFFCDIVGYSRLDPLGQQRCQQTLQSVMLSSLGSLDCKIGKDVIALPTGDGLIFNFLAPDPAVHLRTAILALEGLEQHKSGDKPPFELRIGLNSFVDSWVVDINGRKNVVGTGINIAQRVMDLGAHGQILMHDNVRHDLSNYPEFKQNISFRGDFQVKHGVTVQIAQYTDPQRPYINAELLSPSPTAGRAAFDMDYILGSRIRENVLSLTLDHRARAHLADIEDFVIDFLDKHEALQQRKVAVSWIVGELIANVFEHSRVESGDQLTLKIDLTRAGTRISLSQPHDAEFRPASVGGWSSETVSFLKMMKQQGFVIETTPDGRGGLTISVEIPDSYAPEPLRPLRLDLATGHPSSNRPSYGGLWSLQQIEEVLVGRMQGRIDDQNYEAFLDRTRDAAEQASAETGKLIIDMSGLEYLSSRGLRCLLMIRRDCEAKRVAIALAGPNETLCEILSISRYDKMFAIYADIDSARASLVKVAGD